MKARAVLSGEPAVHQFSVRDFGPIAEADIDLRPLTVFVGPNNTGKSYLATLIYALCRHFGRYDKEHTTSSGLRTRIPDVAACLTEAIAEMNAALPQSPAISDDHNLQIRLPAILVSLLQDLFAPLQPESLQREISRCFGQPFAALPRKNGSGAVSIELRSSDGIGDDGITHSLQFNNGSISSSTHFPPGFQIAVAGGVSSQLSSALQDYWQRTSLSSGKCRPSMELIEKLGQLLTKTLVPVIYRPFVRNAHFLPADRAFVMRAYNLLASSGTRQASMAGLQGTQPHTALRGTLGDFLENLMHGKESESAFHRGQPTGVMSALGDGIERALLGGSIERERSGVQGFPSFRYTPTGWAATAPLSAASSTVTELAPVAHFLRHAVIAGDLLIIEEPESHLHPEMQVEFIRQLVAIVKAGVHVLITTHSDWILEELANRVSSSTLTEEQRRDISGDLPSLSHDDVGVWRFETGTDLKGSNVRRIEVDDSGVYPAGYDRVNSALYNEWARLNECRKHKA